MPRSPHHVVLTAANLWAFRSRELIAARNPMAFLQMISGRMTSTQQYDLDLFDQKNHHQP